jgi:hypothetical protein
MRVLCPLEIWILFSMPLPFMKNISVSMVTKWPQLGTGAPATLLLSVAGHLELQLGVVFNDVIFVSSFVKICLVFSS